VVRDGRSEPLVVALRVSCLDTNAMESATVAATVRATDLPRYSHTAVLTGSVILLALLLVVLGAGGMAAWVGWALVESLPTAGRKAAANCSQLTNRSAAVLANAGGQHPVEPCEFRATLAEGGGGAVRWALMIATGSSSRGAGRR